MARKIPVKLIMELRDANMSQRAISKSRKVSQHSVSEVFKRAAEMDLTFEEVRDRTDDEVYRLFYPNRHVHESLYENPDYSYVHGELKKVGVTLKSLWQEYRDYCRNSEAMAMGYTRFCEGYNAYVKANSLTNHIVHKPGVTCEVDWAGPSIELIDPTTLDVAKVFFFVAVLPYSQYTYVEPCLDMKQDTWITCNVNMFEYFGGSTVRIVCDNLKTGVITNPKEGDIVLNEQYEEFGNHYYTAIMPAGIKKPKHKASVEGAVDKSVKSFIGKHRNDSFNSLHEIRAAVNDHLKDYNQKPFQKREGSRDSIFYQMEQEQLRPLPKFPYEISEWSYGHLVNSDCHVAFKTNRYSVPYKYVGSKVDIKANQATVEIYLKNERLWSYPRTPDYMKHQWITCPEHLPDYFTQNYPDEESILSWASSIGPATTEVINRIFNSMKTKSQAFNPSLSVLRLSKKYSCERLEAACSLALEKIRVPRYSHLKSILASNQDHIYMATKENPPSKSEGTTGYVRGAQYYGGDQK